MYKSFYKLDRKPFETTPDTSFHWLGESYSEALATLRSAILDNKGFLLLTGDSGIGKTSLIKVLIKSLDAGVEWGVIENPNLERIDFYNEIAANFGIDKKFTSKVQFLIQFSHFLHKADDDNKKIILIVDECHLLSQEMLEELRLLSNIEKAETKLINIFFVGENSFNEMLAQPKNRAVRQRLASKIELPPLSVYETEACIRHRLNVAGAEDKIFSAKACQMVHQYSAGVPLQINKICDAALSLGAHQGESTISLALLKSSLDKGDRPTDYAPVSIGQDVVAQRVVPGKDYAQFKLGDRPDSKITGFNLDAGKGRSWRKFGLGALVLVLVVGGYLFKSYMTPGLPKENTAQIVEQVEPLRQLPNISTSPAVVILEGNDHEINRVKADELKSAILAKAYRDEEGSQPLLSEVVVEASGVASELPDAELEGNDVAAVDRQFAEEEDAVNSIVEAIEAAVSLNVEIMIEELAVADVDVQQERLEPRKVMLPLLANSLELTRVAKNKFNSFAEKLKNYPKATILIKGFVSSKTNSLENIQLSEKRALNVYKLLLEKGIEPEQIEMKGMGNREPVASNDTRAGRTKNRRVEIVVISDGRQ